MRETEFSPNPRQELADVEAITCVNTNYHTLDRRGVRMSLSTPWHLLNNQTYVAGLI